MVPIATHTGMSTTLAIPIVRGISIRFFPLSFLIVIFRAFPSRIICLTLSRSLSLLTVCSSVELLFVVVIDVGVGLDIGSTDDTGESDRTILTSIPQHFRLPGCLDQ